MDMDSTHIGRRPGPCFSTASFALRLGICFLVGLSLWISPAPRGLTTEAWHVLAVFSATIASFLLRPLPMAPMVLIGLTTLAVTRSLPVDSVLIGYGNKTVWLVVAAFLIGGAIGRTGLGHRLALLMVVLLGRSTLGLGYAACTAELVLGPLIPSNTARGGGVVAPIQRSLSRALGSDPNDSPRRAGEYLMLVGAHANFITAAMFLTGMAANPIISAQAADVFGLEFDWLRWAQGSILPGLIGLAFLPLLIYKLATPEIADARAARESAYGTLSQLGPWTRAEKYMAGLSILLIVLWSTTRLHGVSATVVAWLGVSVLFLTRIERWEEVRTDPGAWDALVWIGGLLSMAEALKTEGVVAWFGAAMEAQIDGLSGVTASLVIMLIYFYSMYGFSMLTSHITALAGAFLILAHGAECPPILTVGMLAYFSNLCACLTHYSTGPVVIYFGYGYVPANRWLKIGLLVSLYHIAIWLTIGLAWWKALGWW